MFMISGSDDDLADPTDVKRLMKILPKNTKYKQV